MYKKYYTVLRTLLNHQQPHLIAIITAIMGVVNLLSGTTPAMAGRVRLIAELSPLEVRRGSHLTAVLAGFALLLLARGLWRRKYNAWWLTLAILALSVLVHLLKGLDYEEATLALFIALLLWRQRSHFHALSDPPSFWQGVRVLGAALFFTLAYGAIGFYLLDRHFRVHYHFAAAVRQTTVMFTQFYNPELEPLTGFGRYFAGSIYLVGAITGGYALLMLLQPVLMLTPAGPSERQRAAKIVAQYGRSSLARFVLFADKHYFFSPGGSVIGYVVRGHAAVALGDPIGSAADAAAAIAAFQAFCERHDWAPAFYQTLPDTLALYQAAGFEGLCIGHEGIVQLDQFTISGVANKNRRAIFNRFTRQGYQALVHEPPLSDALLAELRSVSDEWLTMMHGSEQRFSLGWFEDEYVRQSRVIVLYTSDGAVIAFINILPEYQKNELSMDLMRRRQALESGAMEFLLISLLQWAKGQGVATFNLGLSALSGVGEKPADPMAERMLHYIYEHLNQFYNFKGLHTFKEKFHPVWSPRYLIYPNVGRLPAIATTLVRAGAGDDVLIRSLRAVPPLLKQAPQWVRQQFTDHRGGHNGDQQAASGEEKHDQTNFTG